MITLMCHMCLKINDVTVILFHTMIVHLSVLSSRSWTHANKCMVNQFIRLSMNIDHDWKTRKLSVQLRGIKYLQKEKNEKQNTQYRQNEYDLMYMTKSNVIHYSKRIIMDCLFRVVQTIIMNFCLFELWHLTNWKKMTLFFF